MEKLSKALLAVTALSAFSASASNITINYLKPMNDDDKASLAQLKDSQINELVIELGKTYFPFTQTLTIEYGSDDGPLFNPETNVIQMPYHFMAEANHYFTKNKYDEKFNKSAQAGAIDTILHTLFHEIAHAYIADKNIPVLGKEEDAADNLAAVMMIEYVDNGADSAISAADMFAFESEDMPKDIQAAEYIDEHSFNLQRYFQTLCLVYGSDPEQYSTLLDEVGDELGEDGLADRKAFCEMNYHDIYNNWHVYLGKPTS